MFLVAKDAILSLLNEKMKSIVKKKIHGKTKIKFMVEKKGIHGLKKEITNEIHKANIVVAPMNFIIEILFFIF